MRQRALEADIVVVNHHLLCADLAVKDGSYGEVIPSYDTVILDEAHLLEDVATQYFGVAGLVAPGRRPLPRRGARAEGRAARRARGAGRGGLACATARRRLFKLLVPGKGRRLGPGWMTPRVAEESGALLLRLDGLRTAILALPERPEPLTGLAGRAQALKDEIALRARGRRRQPRLLRRDARPRRVPAGHAHRRLGHAPGAAVRPRAGGGAHLGHPGRGRRLRLPEGAARDRGLGGAAAALAVRLRAAGAALRAAAACRSPRSPAFVERAAEEIAAAPRDEPRPRLRAVHLVREHERGGRADRRASCRTRS